MRRENKPIVLDPAASDELDAIYDYTLQTWGVSQAARYLDGLEKHLDRLRTKTSNVRHFLTDQQNEVPFIRYERHFIFFQERTHAFYILAIMHERMDISNRLSELLGE